MKLRWLDVVLIVLAVLLFGVVVRQWALLQRVRVPAGPPAAQLPTRDTPGNLAQPWAVRTPSEVRSTVEKLRAIGCPESTIREVAAVEFVRQYVAKQRGELARLISTNSWQATDWAPLLRQRRVVEEQLTGLLAEVFGPDTTPVAIAHEWMRVQLDLSLGFLPTVKRSAAADILLRYVWADDLARLLSEGRPVTREPEELRLMVEEFDRKKAELGQLLSQDEFETVDMITSWTGENLRRATAKFQPTAEEFGVIFREWRSHDERLVELYANGKPDPGNNRVFDRIQQHLSPERYAEFRRLWWK